jgi:NitT/TauT family transport system permease protein
MTRKERRDRRIGHLISVVILALVLLGWERLNQRTANYLSRPIAIAKALRTWFRTPSLRNDIPITLEEAAIGFIVCMGVAIVLAVALASSRLWTEITAPYIAFWNAVPKIALAPLFILVFGTGLHAKVYFIVVGIFIVPFFSLYRALTAVDPIVLNHARVIGAGRWELARDVYMPATAGSLAAVLRVTTQFCLLGAVFSELLAASSGLGFEINTALQVSQPNFTFAGVFIVSLIGFILDLIIVRIARRFATWRIVT